MNAFPWRATHAVLFFVGALHCAPLHEVRQVVLRCVAIVTGAAVKTDRGQQRGRAGVPVGVRAAAVHCDGEWGVSGSVAETSETGCVAVCDGAHLPACCAHTTYTAQ